MTTEQHDSKTEGRGDLIARIEIPLRKSLTFKDAEQVLSILRQAPAASPQSPAEPGQGDVLSRHESMAALEREIVHLRDKSVECATTGLRRDIQLRRLEAELSRLRNEGGDEGAADHKTIWLSPDCGGGECHDERTWHEDSRGCCDECGKPETKYIRADLAASPSDLPAREAIERVTLQDCDPGLFLFDGTLGFKSEYLTPEGLVEAFVVESGEFFWGQASNPTERSKLLVQPLDAAALQPLSQGNGEAVAWRTLGERIADDIEARWSIISQSPSGRRLKIINIVIEALRISAKGGAG